MQLNTSKYLCIVFSYTLVANVSGVDLYTSVEFIMQITIEFKTLKLLVKI